jgi:hypothetical protein
MVITKKIMVSQQLLLRILTVTYISFGCRAFTTTTTTTTTTRTGLSRSTSSSQTAIGSSTVPTDTASPSSSWFSSNDDDDDSISISGTAATASSSVVSVERLKIQLLQLGAALDRGQAYNPTSGSYYEENMNVARNKIEQLLDQAAEAATDAAATSTVPNSLEDIDGEWELILSTVPHGIFRSSPFFLAIQVRCVDMGYFYNIMCICILWLLCSVLFYLVLFWSV